MIKAISAILFMIVIINVVVCYCCCAAAGRADDVRINFMEKGGAYDK